VHGEGATEEPAGEAVRGTRPAGLVDGGGRGLGAGGARRPGPEAAAAASLHVTLVFLGYRPEEEIGRIGEIVAGLAGPAPRIELRDPVRRPERGRPRLFALPISSPETVLLQGELEERLVAERLHEPERRPFWPHLTVARVRPEARGSKRPRPVERPPGPLPEGVRERTFDSVRVSLYLSELKPQGAQYTPLAHVDLSPSGQQ
jgi:2'-5' RNA ligase